MGVLDSEDMSWINRRSNNEFRRQLGIGQNSHYQDFDSKDDHQINGIFPDGCDLDSEEDEAGINQVSKIEIMEVKIMSERNSLR